MGTARISVFCLGATRSLGCKHIYFAGLPTVIWFQDCIENFDLESSVHSPRHILPDSHAYFWLHYSNLKLLRSFVIISFVEWVFMIHSIKNIAFKVKQTIKFYLQGLIACKSKIT